MQKGLHPFVRTVQPFKYVFSIKIYTLLSKNGCLEQECERGAVFQIFYGISGIYFSVGQREFFTVALGLKFIFFKSSQNRLGVRVDSK